MAGVVGLEPTDAGIKILCLTDLAIPQYVVSQKGFEPLTHGLEGRCSILLSYWPMKDFMERVKRIELSQLAWKARALPLSYTRINGGGDWIRTSESAANGFTVRPLWPTREPHHSLYCFF